MPKSAKTPNVHPALTFVSFIAAICIGCAAPGPVHWRAGLGRTHPLTGQIWDIAARAPVTEDELADRLGNARFVLLGEQHESA